MYECRALSLMWLTRLISDTSRFPALFDVQEESKNRINNAFTSYSPDTSYIKRQLLGFGAKRRGAACVTSPT
ncbi:hypothetical protein J6590_028155 [Homalodisca vitripennis]|nr:hypothetical protein J6590_028155 [Homalodisca vitripennis]